MHGKQNTQLLHLQRMSPSDFDRQRRALRRELLDRIMRREMLRRMARLMPR
ncbi:MAG: hypothetical protein WCR23_12755 [Planctomycetota bacterium]